MDQWLWYLEISVAVWSLVFLRLVTAYSSVSSTRQTYVCWYMKPIRRSNNYGEEGALMPHQYVAGMWLISHLFGWEAYLFCSQLHGLREEIWLFFKNNGLVLLYYRFFLCSFRRLLSDFLRCPTDCFSRNPLALIERDQKHLAVVFFVKHFIGKGLPLTTTLLITLHIISATDSAVCFSYWYGKLAKGAREGMLSTSMPPLHDFYFL